MPKRKRIQRKHAEDWQTIQQYTLWPEQTAKLEVIQLPLPDLDENQQQAVSSKDR